MKNDIIFTYLKQPLNKYTFKSPSGKGSGAWFQTAWFCYKLNLPNQLNFVEL